MKEPYIPVNECLVGVAVLESAHLAMKCLPLIINAYVMFGFVFYPFEVRTYFKYHALAGNRTAEAQEDPRMDKLYACSFAHKVIACE